MTQDPTVTVRQLSARDVETFRALLAVFARAFDDAAGYLAAQPSTAYLEALLGADTFIATVALHGDGVIGGLAAYELPKFEREHSEIYIYDLAVDAGFRRRGVATRLIEHLKGVAARRGASSIFVQADLGDEPATALYAKLGEREDVLHFDIALS